MELSIYSAIARQFTNTPLIACRPVEASGRMRVEHFRCLQGNFFLYSHFAYPSKIRKIKQLAGGMQVAERPFTGCRIKRRSTK